MQTRSDPISGLILFTVRSERSGKLWAIAQLLGQPKGQKFFLHENNVVVGNLEARKVCQFRVVKLPDKKLPLGVEITIHGPKEILKQKEAK